MWKERLASGLGCTRWQRGYAAAVTVAVTRAAQRAGAAEVVLFTDVNNRTSNELYQRLGYVPLEDSITMEFVS